MLKVKLSAFADEYADSVDEQIIGLRENGVPFAELRGLDGKNVSSLTREEMETAHKKLSAGGIGVSSIGSPIGKIDVTGDFDAHLKQFENTLLAAEVFGTKYIRVFSFFIPKEDHNEEGLRKHFPEVTRRLEIMLREADKRGIILCHENERGIFGESPLGGIKLMKHFGGKLRFVFDHANYISAGYTPYPDAYSLLKPYIEYMHIKDAVKTSDSEEVMPAGLGTGRIKETLADLIGSGFSNYLTVEPHLQVFSGIDELEHGENKLVKNKFASKAEAFACAVISIKKILDEIYAGK
ncbi:hypothetical protein FACS1894219_09550 [Clostridia bacterium]|nr:hypothetical protein FACS1894219_09550 [Clostridia bacterium]